MGNIIWNIHPIFLFWKSIHHHFNAFYSTLHWSQIGGVSDYFSVLFHVKTNKQTNKLLSWIVSLTLLCLVRMNSFLRPACETVAQMSEFYHVAVTNLHTRHTQRVISVLFQGVTVRHWFVFHMSCFNLCINWQRLLIILWNYFTSSIYSNANAR